MRSHRTESFRLDDHLLWPQSNIHVLDFGLRNWTYYNERNPIKSQEVARFKYTKLLDLLPVHQPHFLPSTDPMRIISLPYSTNGESGLVCLPVGDRKTLERLSIDERVKLASPYSHDLFSQSALDLYNAHRSQQTRTRSMLQTMLEQLLGL